MKHLLILISFFLIETSFCQTSTVNLNEIKTIYFKAERHKIQKKYKEAIKLYSQIINTVNSSNTYLIHSYMGRGNCKSWIAEFEVAIADFDKAIALNNKNKAIYFAYSGKTRAYNNLKKYHKALESGKKAIALNSDYPYSFYNLSVALYNTEDYNAAEKMLTKAILSLEHPINKKYRNYNLDVFYNSRGYLRILKKNDKKNGCIDQKKARKLGFAKHNKFYKKNCL